MTPQTGSAVQPAKTSPIAKPNENENAVNRFQQGYDAIEKRAFEIFNNRGRSFGHEVSDWLQAESEILHPLHLEIAETPEEFNVKAEVPGFTAKELNIRVEGNQLIIAGKHESRQENTKGKTIYSEQCAKEIMRSVALPSAVDGSRINATLKDGVLNLEIPKASQMKNAQVEPRQIA